MARSKKKAKDKLFGHNLVIVESPTKARTIGKFLGKGFKVMASMGHVRDLPKSRLGLESGGGFEPTYRVLPAKRKIVKDLAEEAKKSDTVYLAPDPDREGEAIAWHLVEALKLPAAKVRRVAFHEITERAVRESFDHAGEIDMNKVNAQQARRVLDRLVGYNISPLLWKRVARGLSAGRVQSVAVRLIVDREAEIDAFRSEEYWRILASLCAKDGEPFEALLVEADGKRLRTDAEPAERSIADESEARRIVQALEKEEFVVSKVVRQERSVSPPPPFTTSLLQQAAATSLGYSAKRTMAIAQQLYEGVDLGADGRVGLITYMRTDSVRISEEAMAACRKAIRDLCGAKYVPPRPRAFKSRKLAQEAHEAIRPTDFSRGPDSTGRLLTPEQAKLYRLIWTRAMASQMAGAEVSLTQAQIAAGPYRFAASGRVIRFDGFLKLRGHRGDDPGLPPLAEGDVLPSRSITPKQQHTQPPPRYNEASLVRTLEKLGIGRPSTYAPIVSTIQDRGYVVKEDRRLRPTPLGKLVTGILLECFPTIMDVAFTSRMEEELDEVEEAKLDWRRVLSDFYGPFSQSMASAVKSMPDVKTSPVDEACPKCGRSLLIRWSRGGQFVGCTGFAEADKEKQCKYRRPLADEAARPTGLACDRCGAPMIQARGPFGAYLHCQTRPDCKFTMKFNRKAEPVRKFEPVPTERTCAKCGSMLVIRVSARGKRGPRPFLSCSGFPKCRSAEDLPQELSGLGAQAAARWQANAVKNRQDLAKYRAAQGESEEAPPQEADEDLLKTDAT